MVAKTWILGQTTWIQTPAHLLTRCKLCNLSVPQAPICKMGIHDSPTSGQYVETNINMSVPGI